MALTKVSGGILDPGINVAGIVTATGFDGPFIGGSDGINAGIVTATGLDVNGNGDISGNLVVGGNLTANGDFTTLNTTLREVEILRVDANTTAVAGIITQRGSGDILRLYDTNDQIVTVADGGNVLVGTTDSTLYNNGDSASEGIVLRGGDVIDIARKGDLQLTLNRQTNDGPHIAFYRSGGVRSYISTRDNAFCIDVNSTNERLRIDSDGRCIVGGGSHAGGSALVVKGGNQNTYSTIGMFSNHTNPADNTLLSQIRFGSNTTAVGADIRATADAAWGTNDYPTRLSFFTTPDSSNSQQERLRIKSNGYVGVNETNPQYPLHVAGATTNSAPTGTGILMGLQHSHAVIHLNAADNMGCLIDFTTPGVDRRGGILYYHSNNSTVANRDAMSFQTAAVERLRIDSAGLLGLNRTPVYSGLFGGSQKGMHIGGSTAPFLRITSDTSNQGDLVLHAGNSGADISMANMTAGGDIVFWSKPSGGSMQERMRLQDNGEFQLKPPGNAACDLAFKLNNSNDSRIKYYDSGGTYRGAFGFTEYANSTDYPNFHDSFYLLTDPSSNGSLTTAMRINHNGCFILPKQPCFSVAMSSDYESSTDHTADFDTERFDQGDNFNTGNATFTAPVTGKYYMHAAIQTRSGGTASQVHIMGVSFWVNGSVQVSKGSGDQYLGRDTSHYITVHCIRILDLAQGDTVTVRIQLHGSVYIEGSGGSDRCNWQGYLMA